jgi:hypothetical protein
MESTFSLPPEARTHFDQEAESLVAALQPLPTPSQTTPPQGSLAHVPIMAHIMDADIISPVEVSKID